MLSTHIEGLRGGLWGLLMSPFLGCSLPNAVCLLRRLTDLLRGCLLDDDWARVSFVAVLLELWLLVHRETLVATRLDEEIVDVVVVDYVRHILRILAQLVHLLAVLLLISCGGRLAEGGLVDVSCAVGDIRIVDLGSQLLRRRFSLLQELAGSHLLLLHGQNLSDIRGGCRRWLYHVGRTRVLETTLFLNLRSRLEGRAKLIEVATHDLSTSGWRNFVLLFSPAALRLFLCLLQAILQKLMLSFFKLSRIGPQHLLIALVVLGGEVVVGRLRRDLSLVLKVVVLLKLLLLLVLLSTVCVLGFRVEHFLKVVLMGELHSLKLLSWFDSISVEILKEADLGREDFAWELFLELMHIFWFLDC